MPDANDYIRHRLRQARTELGLSQREVAERFGAAQVTISDMERGRSKISAADLLRLATILEKSVLYFLPGVQESDLSDEEQTLIALFRRLAPDWQSNILDSIRNQVQFYEGQRDLATASRQRMDQIVQQLQSEEVDLSVDELRMLAAGAEYVRMDPDGVANFLQHVESKPPEEQADLAYDYLYSALQQGGVYVTVDDEGVAHINAGHLRAFVRAQSQGERIIGTLQRLIRIAGIQLDEPRPDMGT